MAAARVYQLFARLAPTSPANPARSQGRLEGAAEVCPDQGMEPLLHRWMPPGLLRPRWQVPLLSLPCCWLSRCRWSCRRRRLLLPLLLPVLWRWVGCCATHGCRTISRLAQGVGQGMQVLQPAHPGGAVANLLLVNHVLGQSKG